MSNEDTSRHIHRATAETGGGILTVPNKGLRRRRRKKQSRKRFNVRNWMSKRKRKLTSKGRQRKTVRLKEGNSFPFFFVAPRESPFISLPLTLRSESGFPGDVSPSCFSPTHLAVSPRRKPAVFASP